MQIFTVGNVDRLGCGVWIDVGGLVRLGLKAPAPYGVGVGGVKVVVTSAVAVGVVEGLPLALIIGICILVDLLAFTKGVIVGE